ncbi:MAG: hypothetical protein PHH70_03230 [Candidatus Gracilibacteria bacterium]|nr:hypothetical protein [Candidatus Gracilibacteria bacterium]
MYLDSFSYSSASPYHVLKQGQMPREHTESERNNEVNNNTKRLLKEAYIFLSKSRLFGNDPTMADPIRTELERARDVNNTQALEYIIETLKDEKKFILEYARQFANESAENISIYELQGGMQKAYIEKMVYARERQEQINPEMALKQLYAGYQLT